MRYHFIPTRMTTVKTKNSRFGQMQRNWNLHAVFVGMYNHIATVDTVWRFLRELKVELPYDPAVPLGIYPQE